MNNKITKQDLWTEIKILNAKLDKVLDLLQEKEEVEQVKNEVAIKILKTSSDPMDEYYKRLAQEQINKQEPKVTYVPGCVFDKMSPEDRMKPMGISCPCPKCTPYCLSSGSLSDGGTAQTWRPSGDTNL